MSDSKPKRCPECGSTDIWIEHTKDRHLGTATHVYNCQEGHEFEHVTEA